MSRAKYEALARQAAAQHGIRPEVFLRLLTQESGWNPSARSKVGALGIAQFMPATAKGMGIDPLDPAQAIPAAAQLLARNLHTYKGDYAKTLAAYNAGPGAVAKYGGVPPYKETQNYVRSILGAMPEAAERRKGLPPVPGTGRPIIVQDPEAQRVQALAMQAEAHPYLPDAPAPAPAQQFLQGPQAQLAQSALAWKPPAQDPQAPPGFQGDYGAMQSALPQPAPPGNYAGPWSQLTSQVLANQGPAAPQRPTFGSVVMSLLQSLRS